ncbi:MAG: TIGR01777 family oxidoreductase [Myxococcota bacterium]
MSTHPPLWITGGSGLIGRALQEKLPCTLLNRGAEPLPSWDPLGGAVNDTKTALGALVHLAGAPIAEKRWNKSIMKAIHDSRVTGTQTIVNWLSNRPQRPSVLVSASAVGYYGDCKDQELTESSPNGSGFLAEVCRGWEDAVHKAHEVGIRVVIIRFGVVLDPSGGALGKMLPIFRLGGGGPVGSGKQWFPWIHISDVVKLIEMAIRDERMSGVYNAVAPGIVRQKDFAKCLGKVLNRPAFTPAPAFAMKMAFGKMADEALLASQRCMPQRTLDSGFDFDYPELEPALRHLLG